MVHVENDIYTNRMPKERLEKAFDQLATISPEDYEKVKGLANIVRPLRSFLFKTPVAYDMDFEERTILTADGVGLSAWYIPTKNKNSNKLVIFNHALPMCRAGFPGHFGEPFSLFDAVEIDFVIQYKHLTDAGYNVLTYDLRNHGTSGMGNAGLSGIGNFEWQDCVAVKEYVDNDPELSQMDVALYSQCMGGNSQYHAIYRRPDLFQNVKCMVSPMVVSMEAIFDAFSELQGIHQYQELIDLELLKMGGFTAAEMTPKLWASAVTMPLLMIQVKNDEWTRNPEDGQAIFDLVSSEEKELHWIEGTTKRFKDGYNYFGREPERVLAFLDKHMK